MKKVSTIIQCFMLELRLLPKVICLTCTAAILLAKVSGTDVPSATKVMAFTVSFRLMKHPSWLAMSPMMAVTTPIVPIDTKKQR